MHAHGRHRPHWAWRAHELPLLQRHASMRSLHHVGHRWAARRAHARCNARGTIRTFRSAAHLRRIHGRVAGLLPKESGRGHERSIWRNQRLSVRLTGPRCPLACNCTSCCAMLFCCCCCAWGLPHSSLQRTPLMMSASCSFSAASSASCTCTQPLDHHTTYKQHGSLPADAASARHRGCLSRTLRDNNTPLNLQG